MKIYTWLLSVLLLAFAIQSVAAQNAMVLKLNGAIGPATQDYVVRNLAAAVKSDAPFVILEMNTPGGLASSMRGINEAIIASPIPVITYVYPAGARAASAGTFIAYASHFVYMALGTNIGAASPVSITPTATPATSKQDGSKEKSTIENKVLNDAVAYIRSLAQLRERNIEWAEKAVRDAASLSAQDAKKLKVIDGIAVDYDDLMIKLDGQSVVLAGNKQIIDTKDVALEVIHLDWRYKFLSFITDPNIAYILMLVAIYGIFFEFSNPGLILPGVAGVIALFLVLYAFQLMPINYAGLSLVLIGITFMMLELFMPSFGALGLGGIIAFVIGSVMLFDYQDVNYHLSWSLVASMSVLTCLFFFIVLNLAVKSFKKQVVTGKEALVGQIASVLSVENDNIMVSVLGEMWQAECFV